VGGSTPNLSNERELKKPLSEVKEGVYTIEDVRVRRSSFNSVEIVGGEEPFWATVRDGVQIKEGDLSIKMVKSDSFVEITEISQLDKQTESFTLIEGRKAIVKNQPRTLPTIPECNSGEAILVGDKVQRVKCP
jgi:hypothetical protein